MSEIKRKIRIGDDKFIRICSDATRDEFRNIRERELKGELKYGYYAIDNDKGYHYYLVIN